MKTLRLKLKKKWFDMIESGEKPEEYREVKPYWISRLCDIHEGCMLDDFINPHNVAYTFKSFDEVVMVNGYGNHRPTLKRPCPLHINQCRSPSMGS